MDNMKKMFSSSTGRPRLERVNAIRNTAFVPAAAPNETNENLFRLDGGENSEESVENLLHALNLSRADMLGIPAAVWEAGMRRPSSGPLIFHRHPEEMDASETTRIRSFDSARRPAVEPGRRRSFDSSQISETRSVRSEEGNSRVTESSPSPVVSEPITDSTTSSFVSSTSVEIQMLQRPISLPGPVISVLNSQSSDDGTESERSRSIGSQGSSTSGTYDDEATVSTVPWESWVKLEVLGRGSFGVVYKGVNCNGGFFAVKEISLNPLGGNEESVIQLQQEIAVLQDCRHDNIVQYLGTERTQNELYIFLELATEGSLVSLYRRFPLFDAQIRNYTRQILQGLMYLHDRNCVHRDIKCANILVQTNGRVKLADFGMAKQLQILDSMRSCKGSAYWMAPEVIDPRRKAGLPSDIWSLGCTVLEMASGRPPFDGTPWPNVFWKVGHGEAPEIPTTIPSDARDFISQCLQVDPSKRPSAAALLEHPFVTSGQSTPPSRTSSTQMSIPDTPNRVDSLGSRQGRSVRTRLSIFSRPGD